MASISISSAIFSTRLCGLPRACARHGKSAAAAAAAAAVATVKPLGPGRGTAQPEYRAPRASRPKRI